MNAPFRLFGADMSPYALKVRAYLDFKGVDYAWTPRSNANQPEFAKYAKLPLSPLLVDAEEKVLQDSTAMITALEQQFSEPAATPADARLAFIAALLEDYCDEWLNKATYLYRWSKSEDAAAAAKRTIELLFGDEPAPEGAEDAVADRMAGRLQHAGASDANAPIIEASFPRALAALSAHLSDRAFLLGGRPSVADFALYGQVKQWLSDPTPLALVRTHAPALEAWAERVASAKPEGEFESFEALSAALSELLKGEVSGAYLQWAMANHTAFADDDQYLKATIDGAEFQQKTQRMAAKSFAGLRDAFAATGPDEALASLLAEAGCAFAFAAEEEADKAAAPEAEDAPEDSSEAEPDADESGDEEA